MTLFLAHAFGAIYEALGFWGLSVALFQLLARRGFGLSKAKLFLLSFAFVAVTESSFLALLSFASFISPSSLTAWFWMRPLGMLPYLHTCSPLKIKAFIGEYRFPLLLSLLLLFPAFAPATSFDVFTAHYAVAKAFIQQGGLPYRPDYQYIEALPLAPHMWFLPGLAAEFEGAANAVSPLFASALFFLFYVFLTRRVAFVSCLILLATPEFIRIAIDPMVDAPAIFLALTGAFTLRLSARRTEDSAFLLFSTGIFWCFLIGIKQTYLAFPLVWFVYSLFHAPKAHGRTTLLRFFGLPILAGGIWYFRLWVTRGNPFFPYLFSSELKANIPAEHLPPVHQFSFESLMDYLGILFADTHFQLSLGIWFLALLPPIILFSRWKKAFLPLVAVFVLTLLVALYFAPFKNRYALPAVFLFVPWMAALATRAGKMLRAFIAITAVINLFLFFPYFAQPAWIAAKDLSQREYYRFKFYNYDALTYVHDLNPRKMFFVATPVYWLKVPHQLSIFSETHTDYTRIESLESFVSELHDKGITHIVFDRQMVEEAARNDNPYYSARAFIASRCLFWMDRLFESRHVHPILEKKGVRVGRLLPPTSVKESL